MTKVIRVISSVGGAVADSAAAVIVAAKTYAWSARILADVPVYIAIGAGAVATSESFYQNEFDVHVLAVGAGERVSILGTDDGTAWVSEVKESA